MGPHLRSKQELIGEIASLKAQLAELLGSTPPPSLIPKPQTYKILQHLQGIVYSFRFTPIPGTEYISPIVESLTGYTVQEFYAEPELWRRMLHPDDRDIADAHLSNPDGADEPLMLRWVRKDGTILWVEQRSVPIYDEDGTLVAIHGVARNITDQRRTEQFLRNAAEVSQKIGDSFFQSLLELLAATLETDFAFIGELADASRESIQTIAVLAHGTSIENFQYTLKGAPCENVVDRILCCYPERVQELFPDDELLRDLDVESYIGIPLWDTSGVPLGLIAALHSRPLPDPDFAANVLSIIAGRAAAEIERMHTVQALHESRERYREIIENVSEGICQLDPEGVITFANPKMAAMLGYQRCEELIGQSIYTFLDEEAQQQFPQHFDRRKRGIVERYEMRWRRRDGTLFWGMIAGSPLLDSQGRFIGALGIVSDISEQKQAQQDLSESEARYRQLFNNNPVVQLIIDPQTLCIVDGNSAAEGFYRYSREELRSLSIAQINTLPEPEIRRRMQAAVEQKSNVHHFQHRLATGECRDVEIYASPISVGGIKLMHVLVIDITERCRAEKALRDSEHQFKTVTEGAIAGVYIIQDDRLRYVNPAMAHMYGYEPEELINQCSILDLTLPEDQSLVREFIATHTDHEMQQAHCIYRGIHKSGKTLYCESLWRRVDYQGGQAIVGTMLDVTERIQSQEEIVQRNQELALYSEMIRAATSTLEPEHILKVACDGLARIFQVEQVAAGLLDDQDETLIMVTETGASDNDRVQGLSIPVSAHPRAGWLLNNREPIIIPDVRQAADFTSLRDVFDRYAVQSLLIMPLVAMDKVVGFIVLSAATGHIFRDYDIALAMDLISSINQALQNATLLDMARQRASYLAMLNRASTRLSQSSLGLDSTLHEIVNTLVEDVGAAFARVWLTDETGEELILRASAGLYTHIDGSRARIRIEDDTKKLGQVVRERRPILTNDVQKDKRFDHDWARQNGLVSFAGYPLLDGEKLVGGIIVFSRTRMEEAALDVLGAFASHASAAICNAQLYEAERRGRLLAQTLQHSAETLASTLGLEDMLGRIIEQLRATVPCDCAIVMLVEDDQMRVAAARGDMAKIQVGALFDYAPPSMLHDALLAEQAITFTDLGADESWRACPWICSDAQSWLGIPLVARDVIIGFLSVGSHNPGQYTAAERETVSAFARQAALAVENSRILTELEQRVSELREAQAQLERSARLSAVGEIAAGVAHQINNPLTAVIAEVQMLLEDLSPTEPGFQSALAIKVAAYRAGTVVERMLNLVRATPHHLEPIEVNHSVQSAVSLIRTQIEDRNTKLNMRLAPNLPPIRGSETHLEDVWLNLLLNARDAIRGLEHAEVNIVTHLKDNEDAIEVIIEDNGPGIPPDYLNRIFNPFYTTKEFGTGLGLSICQQTIVRHGGSISAENREPGGARFRVILPVYHRK